MMRMMYRNLIIRGPSQHIASRVNRILDIRKMSNHSQMSAEIEDQEQEVTINTLNRMYKDKIPIAMVTAYDYKSAKICDEAGIDAVLVGDSLNMTFFGRTNTTSLTNEEMLHHLIAVRKGLKRAFMIADMPFGTYEKNPELAFDSSVYLLKNSGAKAVKLEGGSEICPQIERLTSVGIVVVGHIGLTPQRANSLGGFKVQGKSIAGAKKLLEDVKSLETAGCSMVVLEAVPEKLAQLVVSHVDIPIIGIGAGNSCGGQILVYDDLMGFNKDKVPRFCKVYETLFDKSVCALSTYVSDVKDRKFPETNLHTFKIGKSTLEKLNQELSLK